MLSHLIRAFALKDQVRSGWVLRGIREPESVADHSWGTAYLCLLHASEAGVDVHRAVAMALVHDLAEAATGDVATRMSHLSGEEAARAKSEKAARELAAMDELTASASRSAGAADAAAGPGGPAGGQGGPGRGAQGEPPLGEIRGLWEEYEAAQTVEARFVRDMNLIDMCLQALRYESEERYDPEVGRANFPDYERLDEFFATSKGRLSTDLGRRLYAEVESAYRAI